MNTINHMKHRLFIFTIVLLAVPCLPIKANILDLTEQLLQVSPATAAYLKDLPSEVQGLINARVKDNDTFQQVKRRLERLYYQARELEGEYFENICFASFNDEGSLLVLVSENRKAYIVDVATGKCIHVLEQRTGLNCAVFSHDGSRIATADYEGSIRIWDVATGKCLLTLEGHEDSINCIVFNHNDSRLATASEDETVRIWDAATGVCLFTLEGHHGSVDSVVFSHDDSRLITVSHSGVGGVWDTATGADLQLIPEDLLFQARPLAISHDGSRIVSAVMTDSSVYIQNTLEGDYLPLVGSGSSRKYAIHSAAFNHDGSRVVLGADDGCLRMLNVMTGECLCYLKCPKGKYVSIAINRDESHIVAVDFNGFVRIWGCSIKSKLLLRGEIFLEQLLFLMLLETYYQIRENDGKVPAVFLRHIAQDFPKVSVAELRALLKSFSDSDMIRRIYHIMDADDAVPVDDAPVMCSSTLPQ